MRHLVSLVLVIAAATTFAPGEVPGSSPEPTTASGDAIREVEDEQSQRIELAIQFLNGTVKRQFADLQAASKDEAVKGLYLPFLAPSLKDLQASRRGAFGFRKRKSDNFDQRPKPLSYSALKTAGALDSPDVWLRIAIHKGNDRPTGRYTPARTDADVERYRHMFNAFALLADFWVQEKALAP